MPTDPTGGVAKIVLTGPTGVTISVEPTDPTGGVASGRFSLQATAANAAKTAAVAVIANSDLETAVPLEGVDGAVTEVAGRSRNRKLTPKKRDTRDSVATSQQG